MYIFYNPNPLALRAGDCAIRAMCKALNINWDKAYMDLCVIGLTKADLPSANHVWGSYLKQNGFVRYGVPDSCPECYTVEAFCYDHPDGTYVLALSGHVVTVENGSIYDSWDSSNETVLYFWHKEDKKE